MNNVNMSGMNPMGGPVGGGMPMMNNGAAGARPPMPVNNDQRAQLNTYIYEYFLRNEMYECAKALLVSEQPLNVMKDSPGRRREDNGSSTGNGDDGEGESKGDFDPKRPADLPDPNLPKECPESCFLYEWWCLFWDMFNAQRGKAEGRNVLQYFTHTQAQSRSKQEQQQMMLRGLRNEMMPQNYPQGYTNQMMRNSAANNMSAQQNELRQKAIQNNRNATPQQLQMMAQQKQQQGMQRDPSSGNDQQRAQSPASAENAPSPSKRPRLDGAGFNPQGQQMPNGRGNGGMPQQFQNTPGNPQGNAQRIGAYQASLGHQQQQQMPNVKAMPNAPQGQGSPMMTQGQSDGNMVANYYNPTDMANGMRPGGQPGQPGASGNHALQDYQMQLMLLEQQNKKRLMMARQEQDNMQVMPRADGSQGAPAGGPNGQPFQGTSPQGPRSVNSPNPGDQMKRTPHMNPTGMPSPLPEGQSRGSPGGGMNFNIPGNPMDPNMNSQYMVGGLPNGMRPPSSHPNNFNGMNMTPQQMNLARQQAAAQQQQGWQGGPNGQMMPQGAQGAPQRQMGTPQQNMPPPSVPAVGAAANANGRTQPASPQQTTPAPPTPNQTNKANPKKKNDKKGAEAKRATKKGSTTHNNSGATPSADAENTGATPTPATPITPVHKSSFNGQQNGAVQPVNGQPAAPVPGIAAQPDPLQGGMGFPDSGFVDFNSSMDFANPNNGNMDVLQDFDFDSFLHQDGDTVNDFNFDTSAFLGDGNEIGAE